jgi:hypothetical protein
MFSITNLCSAFNPSTAQKTKNLERHYFISGDPNVGLWIQKPPWYVSLWYVLHSLFAGTNVPMNATLRSQLITPLIHLIPCPECREHLQQNLSSLSAAREMGDSWSDFIFKLHNKVNEMKRVKLYDKCQYTHDMSTFLYKNITYSRLHLKNFVQVSSEYISTIQHAQTREAVQHLLLTWSQSVKYYLANRGSSYIGGSIFTSVKDPTVVAAGQSGTMNDNNNANVDRIKLNDQKKVNQVSQVDQVDQVDQDTQSYNFSPIYNKFFF